MVQRLTLTTYTYVKSFFSLLVCGSRVQQEESQAESRKQELHSHNLLLTVGPVGPSKYQTSKDALMAKVERRRKRDDRAHVQKYLDIYATVAQPEPQQEGELVCCTQYYRKEAKLKRGKTAIVRVLMLV